MANHHTKFELGKLEAFKSYLFGKLDKKVGDGYTHTQAVETHPLSPSGAKILDDRNLQG